MEHLETKVIVAIKERVNDSEVYLRAWQQEIENLKLVLEKVKNLTTSRLIAVIDDTKKNIKDKYIIMEWIEGLLIILFLFLFYLFLFYFIFIYFYLFLFIFILFLFYLFLFIFILFLFYFYFIFI